MCHRKRLMLTVNSQKMLSTITRMSSRLNITLRFHIDERKTFVARKGNNFVQKRVRCNFFVFIKFRVMCFQKARENIEIPHSIIVPSEIIINHWTVQHEIVYFLTRGACTKILIHKKIMKWQSAWYIINCKLKYCNFDYANDNSTESINGVSL